MRERASADLADAGNRRRRLDAIRPFLGTPELPPAHPPPQTTTKPSRGESARPVLPLQAMGTAPPPPSAVPLLTLGLKTLPSPAFSLYNLEQ